MQVLGVAFWLLLISKYVHVWVYVCKRNLWDRRLRRQSILSIWGLTSFRQSPPCIKALFSSPYHLSIWGPTSPQSLLAYVLLLSFMHLHINIRIWSNMCAYFIVLFQRSGSCSLESSWWPSLEDLQMYLGGGARGVGGWEGESLEGLVKDTCVLLLNAAVIVFMVSFEATSQATCFFMPWLIQWTLLGSEEHLVEVLPKHLRS